MIGPTIQKAFGEPSSVGRLPFLEQLQEGGSLMTIANFIQNCERPALSRQHRYVYVLRRQYGAPQKPDPEANETHQG